MTIRAMFMSTAIAACSLIFAQDNPPPKPRPPVAAPKTKAAPAPTLLLQSDLPCEIALDDKKLGTLDGATAREFKVTPGQHLLVATSSSGGRIWKKTLEIASTGQRVQSIDFADLSQSDTGNSGASILVRADWDCRLVVDGNMIADLKAGQARQVKVGLGEHLVQAESAGSLAHWETKVTLDKPIQVAVTTGLHESVDKQRQAQEQDRRNAEAREKAGTMLNQAQGTWTHVFETDVSGAEGQYTFVASSGNAHVRSGNGAGRHEKYTWELTLGANADGSLSGSMTRLAILNLIQTPGKKMYDSFTWNGGQFTRVAWQEKYDVRATLDKEGQIVMFATYLACQGACGDMDNDRKANDKVGIIRLRLQSQLEWTCDKLNPPTKVFLRK